MILFLVGVRPSTKQMLLKIQSYFSNVRKTILIEKEKFDEYETMVLGIDEDDVMNFGVVKMWCEWSCVYVPSSLVSKETSPWLFEWVCTVSFIDCSSTSYPLYHSLSCMIVRSFLPFFSLL